MKTQIAVHSSIRDQSGFGLCFIAILIWIAIEYGRPTYPLKLPLIISSFLFLNWLILPEKKWSPQIVCFLLLAGEMLLLVALADNNYSAFWATYQLLITLLFICIPLIHFVDSMRKVSIFISTFLIVFLYIGVVAVLGDGMGPGRNQSGQDENYTAALMCMAIPIAAFLFYFVQGGIKKILLIGALVIYVAAVIVGLSRGGFLGLAVAFLYCLVLSPKKWIGISVGALGIIAVLLLASHQYWDEVSSITHVHEGTADLRIQAWKIGMRIFLHNPILGVGPDNFKWHMVEFQSPEQWEEYDRGIFVLSHSSFIDLFSELGLIGATLFGAVLYFNYKDVKFMTKDLEKRAETLKNENRGTVQEREAFLADCRRIRCYAYGLMGGILGLLVAFAFLSGLYYSNFWVLTSMVVALKKNAVARLEEYENLPLQTRAGKTLAVCDLVVKQACASQLNTVPL
jgi:O-antigen ligase